MKSLSLLISIIFFVLFNISSIIAADKLEINGFYIGQPFLDVWENINKIKKSEIYPDRIDSGVIDIYPFFDKNYNLYSIHLSITNALGINDSTSDKEKIAYAIEFMKKHGAVDKSDKNQIRYEYKNNDDKLTFWKNNASSNATFVLEKFIPPTGPIVKNKQLGMDNENIIPIRRFSTVGLFKKYPDSFDVKNKPYSTGSDLTVTTNFIFYPDDFGLEKVNDDFVNQFMQAYHNNSKEISLNEFKRKNGFSDDDHISLSNGIQSMQEDRNDFRIFEDNDFYIIFAKPKGDSLIFKGAVAISHKVAIPFIPGPLPRKATFN